MKTKEKPKRKPKLNVPLLRKIQAHITEIPNRFVMTTSVARGEPGKKISVISTFDAPKRYPPCGTVACIAGWANILTNARDVADIDRANKKLGLPDDWGMEETYFGGVARRWLEHPLFWHDRWPEPFRTAFLRAKTAKQRAKIASERIEHLIETGE